MLAASPSPTMDSTKVGGPSKVARPPLWRRRKAASIVGGEGEAAHIANTCAYTFQMCPYFYILLLHLFDFTYSRIPITIMALPGGGGGRLLAGRGGGSARWDGGRL